jgi:hypothetical protein
MRKRVSVRTVYYSDVYDDRAPSIHLLHETLGRYSADSVLALIAAINFVRGAANLAAEEGSQKQLWRALVRTVFGQRQVRRKIGDDAPHLFGRPILLFIAREALKVCPIVAPNEAELIADIGRAVFIAGDLLFPKTENVDDGLLLNVAQNQFVGTGIWNRLVRSVKMTESLSSAYEKRYGVAPDSRFKEAIGLDISEFQDICLSFFLNFLAAAERLAGDHPEYIDLGWVSARLGASPLPESGIASWRIERFTRALSSKTSAAREGALSCSNPFDFTLFRQKPFVTIGDGNLVLIDPGFLLDKMDKGPFFSLLDDADKKQRASIFSLWGTAFEEFAGWLLTTHLERSSVLISPRFRRNNENEEICDVAVCRPAATVLIECKGCYFSGNALESLNAETLGGEILKKLEGDDDTPKGATQLANAIRRLYDSDSDDETSSFEIRDASLVYPVLVVRDEIADTFLLNKRLNEAFAVTLGSGERSATIRPLVCLSIGVLQNLLELLKQMTLAELLEERIKANPELTLPAGLVLSRMFRDYGEPSEPIFEIVTDRCKRLGLRLDPQSRRAMAKRIPA